MRLSYPQTYEPFIFLTLKIWILVIEICLETEDVFKFDCLDACKDKKAAHGWLAKSWKFKKIQNGKFKKIKGYVKINQYFLR